MTAARHGAVCTLTMTGRTRGLLPGSHPEGVPHPMTDRYGYPYVAPSLWAGAPTCTHAAPDSCPRCDRTYQDEWALQQGAEERLARVRIRMRRDREYRRQWLLSLPSAMRRDMATFADNTHGPMPGLIEEIEGTS